jgi:hypothetical protein
MTGDVRDHVKTAKMSFDSEGAPTEGRPYGFPGFAESPVGAPRRGRPVRPILDDRAWCRAR